MKSTVKNKKFFSFFCAGMLFPLALAYSAPLADFYWSGDFSLPENKTKFSHGAKLRLSVMELRYFDSFEKYQDVLENQRYSLAFDLSKFSSRIGAKIVLGKIKGGTSMRVSKLTSAPGPFVSDLSDAGTLKVTLPSKSSASKELAAFCSVKISPAKKWTESGFRILPFSMQGFVCENRVNQDMPPFWLGASGGFLYKNCFRLTESFFFRRYFCRVEETADARWFMQIPVRTDALLNSFCNELSFSFPYFSDKITFCAQEEKESLTRFWIRNEALLNAGSFKLSVQLFLPDNFFIDEKTPFSSFSSQSYKQIWQAKIVPEMTLFLDNAAWVKFGAGAFFEEKILNYGKKSECNSVEAKFSTGAQFHSKKNSAKITGTVGMLVLHQEPDFHKAKDFPLFSVNANFSHKFGGNGGTITLSGGASFQPEHNWQKRKWTESMKISYSPKNFFLTKVSAGFSASQKDGKNTISPGAAAAFLVKCRKVNLNTTVSVQGQIE